MVGTSLIGWFVAGALAPACPQTPETERVQPESAFQELLVDNQADRAQRGIVRGSLPFARGALRDASYVEVDGRLAPAVVLMRWPDESVAVLQAHVPVEVPARQLARLRVRPVAAPAAEPVWPGAWSFDGELALRTELTDPWGGVYTARLVADGPPLSLSSSLVRVRRYRGVHRRDDAEFLGVVAWVTSFRGERRAELTLALDNGAHLTDPSPLGPVRFRSFALVSEREGLRFVPRFATENALSPALPEGDGYRQLLLGPSDQIYLGDCTAKAFRIDLFAGGAAATSEQRTAAAAAVEAPLLAWPAVDEVRRAGAFGAHGGPAPAGTDQSTRRWLRWRKLARFGPFGGHGDPEEAAEQGTPRNGPSALHNVLRWRSAALLAAAETMVLQHGLRPSPGVVLRLPPELAPFRQGLSERCIARPHGFSALDYEHFSVDLLFDYYWLTGDPWARAELRRMGDGLRAVMDTVPFRTSRGEGWCLQAGVLIARATGDRELVEDLAARARSRVLPAIAGPPTPVAISQPGHDQAFGPGESFDAPWQMAALVHGLHALYAETGDENVAEAAVRTALVMAGPGWVEGVGPKYLVSASQAGRYILPVGYGPMEGTARMEIGAFVLAAEMTGEAAERHLFARRVRALVDAGWTPGDRGEAAERWLQLHLDREAAVR